MNLSFKTWLEAKELNNHMKHPKWGGARKACTAGHSFVPRFKHHPIRRAFPQTIAKN
jgi:hypothetical protein